MVKPIPWDLDERAGGRAWPELRRLARRARRRPLLTLLAALLVTGGVVAMRARKPRIYEATVALRVTESDLDADTAPRSVGNLRDYVASVCFSDARLLSVIKAHDLYPSKMRREERLALDDMRDDIDVMVWRNFFALPRSPDDPGRSARMAVSYQGKDRHLVYEVVHDLARLITDEEETSRIAQAEGALNDADDRVREARAFAQEQHHALVVKEVQQSTARNEEQSARLLLEMQTLIRAARSADDQVLAAENARQTIWMRLQLEKKQLGLQFELIDSGRVPPPGPPKNLVLAIIAVLVFSFSLPLAMLGVGALDTRIYEPEDVRRLGLDALGELGKFGGDNRGALSARLARDGQGGVLQ